MAKARLKRHEIQPGYYYSNRWIRYVAAIDREMAFMSDFAGYSVLRVESLQRWAKERHSPEEAKSRFPKYFAEIAEHITKPPPKMVFWKFGIKPWPQD